MPSPSTLRRVVIGAAALTVAVWPAGGAGGSGRSNARAPAGTEAPSRQDAVAAAAPHSAAVADATDSVTQARAALDELRGQLGDLRTAAYRQNTQVLPTAAEDGLARTRVQQYADVAARALATRVGDAEHALAVAEREQQQALAAYFAALAAAAEAEQAARAAEAQAEAEAQAASQGTISTVTVSGPPQGGCSDDLACFLACTRAHESDTAGGYQAVSPDGMYRGAYQFDQSTWDSVADSIGRHDLVGVDPATASAADQDTLAAALYEMRGNQPWGGRC
jgi:hypothetical protein